jgi:AraC-like DNA-binding protein
MLLKDFLPRPENQDLVRLYRIIHFNFDKKTIPSIKAYPPRPEQVLAFFPREMENVEYSGKKLANHRAVLTGQHDVVFNRVVPHDFLCLQVVFQPTGLYRITGIPSTELCNQYLDAELFFRADLRYVNERLFHAQEYDEMITIADNFIKSIKSQVTKPVSPMDEVSKIMLGKEGNISLDWLAKESSLSIKQFERNFSQRTGITPKIFTRIARFDKAFRMRNEFTGMDWLSIALACGYYDYQHMVKDYKDFTSLTPPEFHLIEDKAPERSLGLHEGFYNSRIV